MSSIAQQPETPVDLILNGVNVVDTRHGQVARNMAVLIGNGRIVSIVPAGSIAASGSPKVIEAAGKFVVPGFLDMHAHILEETHAQSSLDLMLAHGITGWRQMSGSPALLAERKDGKLRFAEGSPELLMMPGQILTPANAATPEISEAEVRKQKADGADFIKTIAVTPKTFFASLREATRQGIGYAGHLSLGVRAEEAAEAGMRSIEHLGPLEMQLMSCSAREWLIRLILAVKRPAMPDLAPEEMATVGRLIIANPTLFRMQMDPGGLQRSQRLIDSFSEAKCRRLGEICATHGTWQVPTLIRVMTMQMAEEPRFAEDPNLRYISRETREFWVSIAAKFTALVTPEGRKTLKQLTALGLRMTKIFDECGVKMLAGSDYGGMWMIPGVSLHQEFDLLAEAGLSPLKVLQMATLNAGEFLHREATLGTVAPGKDANLVVLHNNPLESVANLHGIHAVVRAGRYVARDALEALKGNVAERVASEAA